MPNPLENPHFVEAVTSVLGVPYTPEAEAVDDDTHRWSSLPVHQRKEVKRMANQSDTEYNQTVLVHAIKDTVDRTNPPRPLASWSVDSITNQLKLKYPRKKE